MAQHNTHTTQKHTPSYTHVHLRVLVVGTKYCKYIHIRKFIAALKRKLSIGANGINRNRQSTLCH